MYSLETAIRHHVPTIFLASLISRTWMHRIRIGSAIVALLSGAGTAVLYISGHGELATLTLGTTLIATALWIEQLVLYCYHNYYYFFGLNSILGIGHLSHRGVTYEVAETLYRNKRDVVGAFIDSELGYLTLLRSGLTPAVIRAYRDGERAPIPASQVPADERSLFTMVSLGTWILQNDPLFPKLLREQGIQEREYLGALAWVLGTYHAQKRLKRWWGKDVLSQTTGLGRSFAYGHTYHLQKYTKSLRSGAVFSNLTPNPAFADQYVDQLEAAFARTQSANALLIGKPGVGKMDIIIALQNRIKRGQAVASILDETFVVLDTDALFAVSEGKGDFEALFIRVMNEAVGAGNIIVVINNISTFIREAEGLNVFIPELLDGYLSHPTFHMIAIDTPQNFHNSLQRHAALVRRFEEILIEEPGQESTIRLLQSVAERSEHNGIFTYPALEAIAIGAERYLVDGVMPDKAVSLLTDVANRSATEGQYSPDQVYQLIAEKTGMPVGPVSDDERDVLLNLEETLHARVIGQNQAIDAIARTMRRSRAGIVSGERPIGSFLFLGPTGVGKTETAKALAHTFFGSEENMSRLDMSEFSGQDRVENLIGTSETAGILPSLLQEHPYTVLLLDEFEKADQAVHDLFLQILDEGRFTSGQGEVINARNTIIIATSNAGSGRIIEAVGNGEDLSALTRELIDHIIETGIFRPELINRFDNTILFEPLAQAQQQSVAQLMLRDLKARIDEQGYRLEVTPALLTALVEHGYDPAFGARPMQRVIQNTIEEAVAKKIIGGEVKVGDTITLDVPDVTFVR